MNTGARQREGRAPQEVLGALVLVGLLACGYLLLSAGSAWGGAYSVIECYPSVGVRSADDVSWSGQNNVDLFAVGDCSDGGVGVGAEASGNTGGTDPSSTVVMELGPAAPGTYIFSGVLDVYHQIDVDCSTGVCQSFDNWWGHADVTNGSQAVHPIATAGPGGPQGWYSVTFNSPASGRYLQVYETCATSFCWGLDLLSLKNINLTVVDSQEPTVALSGSLVSNAIAHGVSSLEIAAKDAGSGINDVSVEVNGVPVAAPTARCPGDGSSGYHEALRPCDNASSTLQYDTERQPWHEGGNTLRVCASDVADAPDSPHTVCEQRSVNVDNSCPDSQGANREASSLSAGLQDPKTGALQRARSVRSTEGVALRGSVSGSGAPVQGASVCVYETVDEPAGISQLVQVAKSTSSGEFGVNLPPGPSRIFRVGYRYSDRALESNSMILDSSVVPTLGVTKKKLRNGRSVGFHGQLPGPHADGVAVALQAKVGKKWRTFKQVTSDSSGAFRAKYRFTQTRGGRARYIFRALVKKQGGYPYSEGASPERKVFVRG